MKSIAPSLLLAAPQLGDPNFERKVVLLGKHEEAGAIGWILNGDPLDPVGRLLRLAELVPDGLQLPPTEPFRRVARIGGPVARESGWLLYRTRDASFEGEVVAGEQVAFSSNAAALDAVVHGREPHDFRLYLGYAGWGAGQLEAEMKEGVWLPAELEPGLVFDTPPEELWDVAYRKATGAPATIFGGRNWGLA